MSPPYFNQHPRRFDCDRAYLPTASVFESSAGAAQETFNSGCAGSDAFFPADFKRRPAGRMGLSLTIPLSGWGEAAREAFL